MRIPGESKFWTDAFGDTGSPNWVRLIQDVDDILSVTETRRQLTPGDTVSPPAPPKPTSKRRFSRGRKPDA